MSYPSIDAVQPLSFAVHGDASGALVAIQGDTDLPFPISRVFMVHASAADTVRGKHAHRACQQVLVHVAGTIRVTCTDGTTEKSWTLAESGQGLFVPQMIWAEQLYETANAVLLVACDQPYDASDYIRDRALFEWVRRGD